MIQEILQETNGMCEYALYVKGMLHSMYNNVRIWFI